MSLKRKKKRVTSLASQRKEYPNLTLNEAFDFVVSAKRAEGIRDRTLKDYRKMWGYFTDWLAENYEVDYVSDLTSEVFRNYINWMKYDKPKYSGHKFINSDRQGVGLSDTTININLRSIRAVFNYLEREQLIEVNPIANVKPLRQDVDMSEALTDEELKAIFQQPNQREYVGFRDYVAMHVLLDAGLRINELLSLRVTDIDFRTRFITIASDKSKNRKHRIVPISTHVSKLLLQLISENHEHFRTDRIFMSSYGEPLGSNHFNKRLKFYAEKAGIKKAKVTAHVYRHTWAKMMILNGCDPFTLQKLGGWADIRTMRRYIQMDLREMRESHDNFSPALNMFGRKRL